MMTMTRRQLMRMLPAAIVAAVLPMRLTRTVEAAGPRSWSRWDHLPRADGLIVWDAPPYTQITVGGGSRQRRVITGTTTAVIDIGDTSAWQVNRWRGDPVVIDCRVR